MLRKSILALGILGSAVLWGGAAQAACTVVQDVNNAFKARDYLGAQQIVQAADSDRECREEERLVARGIAGLIRYSQIVAELEAGAELASFEPELSAIAAGGAPPWHVHDMLGDIAKARKDYATAAGNYFQALLLGSNEELTLPEHAPSPDYIRYLHQAGTEMRLAADDPSLNNARGGCEISYRGVEIAEKTVPVRFVRSKAEFTAEGQKSVEELLKCLKSSGATDVTVVGHTDPDGSREFNQKLSEDRAKAVAEYLAGNGFTGKLSLQGKGEDEPFAPDDPGAYDQATLFQMHRRVDVVVNQPS